MGKKEEQLLKDHLIQNRLRLTKQRSAIVQTFLEMQPHVTTEELHQELMRRRYPVGIATIYRTLNLLCQWGVAQQRQFGAGPALYELHENLHSHRHHDHLICTSCGKIIEFKAPKIEALQSKVAAQYRFAIHHHKHELYGLCADCKGKVPAT